MCCYYLRIEGVNLDGFVFDTNDLSTVRGGGLLMLALPEEAKKILEDLDCVYEVISVGASWGLFKVLVDDHHDINSLPVELNKRLKESEFSYKDKNGNKKILRPWQHATWVVDAVPDEDDFRSCRDKVHALNRWHQMQSLSLILPGPEPYKDDIKEVVCGLDFVRPAFQTVNEEGIRAVSRHVSDRRLYGRKKKQDFYNDITGITDCLFTRTLSELACHDKAGCSQDVLGNLDGKMAVIYLDGNSFGKRQQACVSDEEQKKFNDIVKNGQKQFLKELLHEIRDDGLWNNCLSDGKGQEEKRIRIETLLWGGDEIMWVVPAWQGWWLLGYFFKKTGTDSWRFNNEQLTHAAGLVFCHHNAPIHRIKRLAHDLADLAKSRGKETGYVAYQVLESFDHAGTDLRRFRELRCPPGVVPNDLVLRGEDMPAVRETADSLAGNVEFSRRKLHQVVHALYNGDRKRADLLEKKANSGSLKQLPLLEQSLGKRPACWVHLLELWDYLGMEGGVS